jgi:hypothetical protein
MIERLESRTLLSIPEPNETLATAYKVDGGAPFGGMETVTDFAGDSDQRDFYRLSLPGGRNTFTARLYNLTADLQLALIYDANNNGVIDPTDLLKISVNAGTSEELIVRSGADALPASDNYYVEVYRGNAGNSSNYSLDLINDSAADTISNGARTIEGTGAHSFNESLDAAGDTVDLYGFYMGVPVAIRPRFQPG